MLTIVDKLYFITKICQENRTKLFTTRNKR